MSAFDVFASFRQLDGSLGLYMENRNFFFGGVVARRYDQLRIDYRNLAARTRTSMVARVPLFPVETHADVQRDVEVEFLDRGLETYLWEDDVGGVAMALVAFHLAEHVMCKRRLRLDDVLAIRLSIDPQTDAPHRLDWGFAPRA